MNKEKKKKCPKCKIGDLRETYVVGAENYLWCYHCNFTFDMENIEEITEEIKK